VPIVVNANCVGVHGVSASRYFRISDSAVLHMMSIHSYCKSLANWKVNPAVARPFPCSFDLTLLDTKTAILCIQIESLLPVRGGVRHHWKTKMGNYLIIRNSTSCSTAGGWQIVRRTDIIIILL
jgi:hypothetical protein